MFRITPHGQRQLLSFVRFAAIIAGVHLWLPSAQAAQPFELWLVDQSNSPGLSHGGAIHIFDDRDLTGPDPSSAQPVDTVDLGGQTSALCRTSTGADPVRPHMLVFNQTETHAALAFVASGHVVFFEADTRTPVACVRMAPGVNGARQAHAVWPTSDDTHLLVANQNGKRFERISTDYGAGVFTYEPGAALDLAGCVTPNGLPCQASGLRPDNAPICPFIASDNGPAFVSLRGGGLFLVDHEATPMEIVGEYDAFHIPANGCGFIEARGQVYGNGGGGTANNLDQFTVYRLPMTGYASSNPPNEPEPEFLFDDDAPDRDAHGVAVSRHERYVWVGDRAGNAAEVFDAASGEYVQRVDLTSVYSADPTPDLFARSPDGHWLFASLRGPVPLSGDPHASTGSTPGVAVLRLVAGGRTAKVRGVARISNIGVDGVERADAHGIRVRLLSRGAR